MSQCAYSLDALSWTDLPVGPRFDLSIGVDEQNTELITDGGITWTERLFERDNWNLNFKITTAQISAFQALHNAVDGQLNRLFVTLDRTADPVVAIYGWKEAGFALQGTGEPVQPPLFNYRLSISGETMSILALLRSYEFDDLPANPAAGTLARVSDGPGGMWMYSGVQWVRNGGGVNVKDAPFNAAGDGVTDDSAAWAAASAYGHIFAPEGTYILDGFEIGSNCLIEGEGQGRTILKAKTSAALEKFVHIPYGESHIRLRALTIDGNRTGGGMVNAFSGAIFNEGSYVSLCDVEVKGGAWAGIYIGSLDGISDYTSISKCWIHDNGGSTDDTGNGIGILSGGILSGYVTPQHISIQDNIIEDNYNIITKPNDSSGINLTVKGCIVSGNQFKDNFNVNGGHIVLWAYPDQTGPLEAVVSGNHIISSTTFGTPLDRTGGIEIQGRQFSVSGNTMTLLNTDLFGIGIGGTATLASGEGTITGNLIKCAGGNGIDLDTAGLATPATEIAISGNVVIGATNGIATNAAGTNIDIGGNNFSGCTQPQAGSLSPTIHMHDNLPFSVSNSPNGRTHIVAVSIPSASHMTMGNTNVGEITGTTTIDLIDSTGWYNGDKITLYFTDTLTVKSGQAASGAFATIKLAGGADFNATQFDSLELIWNSSTWEQVSASANV